jgi:RND family efflux transporter MFP subunit
MRGLIPVLLILGCVLGCGRGETPDVAAAPEALSIGTVEVTREMLVEPVFGTGTIAAQKTTVVGPRVDGIIEEIHVKVGDRVAAGDPLFRTRQIDYEIRVQEAEYALRLARAKAQKTRRDRRRVVRLHQSQVASDEQVDEARTAHEIAAARFGAGETALARAQQNLEDTIVEAPYAGVITARYVDEGTMMRTMMTSSSRVVQLMKTDVVAAIVQIPEVHLARVHVGTPARVQIDGMGEAYETEVYILNDCVDHKSRAFEVRLRLQNPDLAIKPGLFVEADLLPEAREVTLIDRRALLGAEGKRYVFVAKEGRAQRRAVRTRELDANRVEVLEGLEPGDQALAGPNLPRVREGIPVLVELARAAR